MEKSTETPVEEQAPHPLTIGELADMLPIEEWVAVPGFPGWRVKRCRDGSVITGKQ